jgi:hypothetical protein
MPLDLAVPYASVSMLHVHADCKPLQLQPRMCTRGSCALLFSTLRAARHLCAGSASTKTTSLRKVKLDLSADNTYTPHIIIHHTLATNTRDAANTHAHRQRARGKGKQKQRQAGAQDAHATCGHMPHQHRCLKFTSASVYMDKLPYASASQSNTTLHNSSDHAAAAAASTAAQRSRRPQPLAPRPTRTSYNPSQSIHLSFLICNFVNCSCAVGYLYL